MREDEMTYHASIYGDESDGADFQACSIENALAQAVEWAEDGDWPVEGCELGVTVVLEDDEGDIIKEVTETLHIPSADELRDTNVLENGEKIAVFENQYDTEMIFVVSGKAYYMHPNGGARGSWDRQCGDGVWRDRPVKRTRRIDREEARRLMLDWGYELATVAERTCEIDDDIINWYDEYSGCSDQVDAYDSDAHNEGADDSHDKKDDDCADDHPARDEWTYYADIDGERGQIAASSLDEAVAIALDQAFRAADGETTVRVWLEDKDGGIMEEATKTVEVPSDDGGGLEEIAMRRREYDTEKIVSIDG